MKCIEWDGFQCDFDKNQWHLIHRYFFQHRVIVLMMKPSNFQAFFLSSTVMNSLRDEHFTKYSEYSEWKYFETENAALWLNFTIETNEFQNLSNINNVPPKSINNPECHPKRDPSQDSVCKEFAYNLHTQRRNLCFVRWICCALAVLICWIDWFCIVNILSPVWCAWCYHIHCDSV